MVALRLVVATAAAIAYAASIAPQPAAAAGPQQFLAFLGTDLWRYGDFLYGGLLWSPAGLSADGFTLKLLLDGGGYSYVSGASGETIDGNKFSATALPGWHIARGGLNVSLFAGPTVQDYRETPADPTSRLHGFYVGAQSSADVWYQPNAFSMAAVSGAIASIGPTGYVRAAFGWRLFSAAFVGPEIEEIWCANFTQVELGAHVTALRISAFEWSLGSGLALTSDQRSGPYLRIGISVRY